MANIPTLPPGRVIDVRGGSAGLGKGIAALGKIVKGLAQSDEDKAEEFFTRNPELGPQYAARWREIKRAQERMDRQVGEPVMTEEGPKFEGAEEDLPDVRAEELIHPVIPTTGETIPTSILERLSAAYPETEEERFGTLLREEIPVEEEVEDIVEKRELEREERELRLGEIGDIRSMNEAMEKHGVTPDLKAQLAYARIRGEVADLKLGEQERRIKGKQLEAQEELLDDLTGNVLSQLTPDMRELAALGQLPGLQGVTSAIMQERAWERQDDIRALGEGLSTSNLTEATMARFENRTKIRNSIDDNIEALIQDVEEKGGERAREFADRIERDIEDLLVIDSRALVPILEMVHKTFNEKDIKGLEFSFGNIASLHPERYGPTIEVFRNSPMNEAEITELRRDFNDKEVAFIVNQAVSAKSEEEYQKERTKMLQKAMAWSKGTPEQQIPETLRKTESEIRTLNDTLEKTLDEDNDATLGEVTALMARLKLLEMRRFFLSGYGEG